MQNNTEKVKTLTLTVKQVEAIARLSVQGWLVDVEGMVVERDGMAVTMMTSRARPSNTGLCVGIHPEGSTHT
jgi:hypothetical protein